MLQYCYAMCKKALVLMKDLGMKCTYHCNLLSNNSAKTFHTHTYMELERKRWGRTQILKSGNTWWVWIKSIHVLLQYSFNFSIGMKFIVEEGSKRNTGTKSWKDNILQVNKLRNTFIWPLEPKRKVKIGNFIL